MGFHPKGQYLVINQTKDREFSDYENVLGDALERCFAAGVQDLDGLVRGLVDYGVPAPEGKAWTKEFLASELKRLGA